MVGEIAAARRESPWAAGQHLRLADTLTADLPHTLAALTRGETSEWRAAIMVRETSLLSVEHRRQVDAELGGRIAGLGDKGLAGAAAAVGYRLDPEQAVKRNRKAEGDRRVSIRPAPDTMTYLTALLPVAQGVAVYAALFKQAATLTAAGDPRSRGQLMADELVHRVTQTAASNSDQPADLPAGASLDIHLVMTDKALHAADSEPAVLIGYGPIPAPIARRLVCGADEKAKVWVRRLFTDPAGTLVDGDPTRRLFPRAAGEFLIARDQTCRTPWCDAPIRHADHIDPHSAGGATDIRNGQGLCKACNQRKHTASQHRADPPSPPGAPIRKIRPPKKHAGKAKRIYLLPPPVRLVN